MAVCTLPGEVGFTEENYWVRFMVKPSGATSLRRFRWGLLVSVALWVAASVVVYFSARPSVGVAIAARFMEQLIPSDPGTRADAIVILGRGTPLTPQRVATAIDLWRNSRAPIIFVSGIYDAPRVVEQLNQQGVPSLALGGEACSTTTIENALYTAALLKPTGIQSILLVTDVPHMARSILIFRKAGFQVIPHPASLPADWGNRQRSQLLLREYSLLAAYGLMYPFHNLEETLEARSPTLMEAVRDRRCQI